MEDWKWGRPGDEASETLSVYDDRKLLLCCCGSTQSMNFVLPLMGVSNIISDSYL